MPRVAVPPPPAIGTLVIYRGQTRKATRHVRVIAEASGGHMIVEAIGRNGQLVRLTVKQKNLLPKQPDLFDLLG